jgi:hypothetical protein
LSDGIQGEVRDVRDTLHLRQGRLFATDDVGRFVGSTYIAAERVGQLGRVDSEASAAQTQEALDAHLAATLPALTSELAASDGPVVVMANGFQFDPRDAITSIPTTSDNPHGTIFHFVCGDEGEEARKHTTGWPGRLHMRVDDKGFDGLAVPFGWFTLPEPIAELVKAKRNFYEGACALAVQSAWPFALVLDRLAAAPALENRPVDIMCHSLGSRLVIKALTLATKRYPALFGRLGRIIILGGAEYVLAAQKLVAAMKPLPKKPEIYNIGCKSDDVLIHLGQNFGPGEDGDHRTIGIHGLALDPGVDWWVDIPASDPTMNEWLSHKRGSWLVGDRSNHIADHWAYFTTVGNMRVFEKLLRHERKVWATAALRKDALPKLAAPPVA